MILLVFGLAVGAPVVRVFFNETAPTDEAVLWQIFAPSLADSFQSVLCL